MLLAQHAEFHRRTEARSESRLDTVLSLIAATSLLPNYSRLNSGSGRPKHLMEATAASSSNRPVHHCFSRQTARIFCEQAQHDITVHVSLK